MMESEAPNATRALNVILRWSMPTSRGFTEEADDVDYYDGRFKKVLSFIQVRGQCCLNFPGLYSKILLEYAETFGSRCLWMGYFLQIHAEYCRDNEAGNL